MSALKSALLTGNGHSALPINKPEHHFTCTCFRCLARHAAAPWTQHPLQNGPVGVGHAGERITLQWPDRTIAGMARSYKQQAGVQAGC